MMNISNKLYVVLLWTNVLQLVADWIAHLLSYGVHFIDSDWSLRVMWIVERSKTIHSFSIGTEQAWKTSLLRSSLNLEKTLPKAIIFINLGKKPLKSRMQNSLYQSLFFYEDYGFPSSRPLFWRRSKPFPALVVEFFFAMRLYITSSR